MAVLPTLTHILPQGSGATMTRMTKKEEILKMVREANIVKTINNGGATILIADNYCAKTPEDIEKVVQEYYSVGWLVVRRMRERGIDI